MYHLKSQPDAFNIFAMDGISVNRLTVAMRPIDIIVNFDLSKFVSLIPFPDFAVISSMEQTLYIEVTLSFNNGYLLINELQV